MGYEMSSQLLIAAQLSREVREGKERLDLAIAAADIALWEWNIGQDVFWSSDRCRTRLVP